MLLLLLLLACAPPAARAAAAPAGRFGRGAGLSLRTELAPTGGRPSEPERPARQLETLGVVANIDQGESERRVRLAHRSSVPPAGELKTAYDVDKWIFPWWITRHQHQYNRHHQRTVLTFLKTAGVLDVCLILSTITVFAWMYGYFLKWPNAKTPHWLLLLGWTLWGVACMALVCVLSGSRAGSGWVTGYLLELVFSVENVFVFHVVCQAFKAPAHLTQKALFAVILGQIAFQALFFMGLAHWLHQSLILPYLLGMWLLYVGVQTSKDHNHGSFDVRDSLAFRVCHAFMGDRLSPEFPQDGHIFFYTSDGLVACTMLLPLTVCLIFVDVLFEVDVTLTKIETLDNNFRDFSSSVVAACAVPELYFVARRLFAKYQLLRYGVAFVLLFYGAQLLFHRLYELPALWGIVVVTGVMIVCITLSDGREVPQKHEGLMDSPRDEAKKTSAEGAPGTDSIVADIGDAEAAKA